MCTLQLCIIYGILGWDNLQVSFITCTVAAVIKDTLARLIKGIPLKLKIPNDTCTLGWQKDHDVHVYHTTWIRLILFFFDLELALEYSEGKRSSWKIVFNFHSSSLAICDNLKGFSNCCICKYKLHNIYDTTTTGFLKLRDFVTRPQGI